MGDASNAGNAKPADSAQSSRETAPSREQLQQRVDRLEDRLTRLERYLGLVAAPAPGETAAAAHPATHAAEPQSLSLEMRIGEFWLARLGVVALLIGLVFLITYPFTRLPAWLPCLIGYLAGAGLLAMARHWRTSLPHFAAIVFNGAWFLLYFATLRLHFFSRQPVVTDRTLGLALLVIVLGAAFYLAARRHSQFTAGLIALLCFVTSAISRSPQFGLLLMTATAATTLWLLRRYNWQALLNTTIGLAYLAHLLWLLDNPPATTAAGPGNLGYLFVTAGLFALANCFHYQTTATVPARILRTILNGAGLFSLAHLTGLRFSPDHLARLDLVLAAGFLGVAVLYWVHRHSRYSTSIYACFGYLALSAAIVDYFPAPDRFAWLGWQSLLVAITAVWFCSKIVIVTNVFIYLGVCGAWLATAPPTAAVNLSFALVALVSARILDWQQQRLELRTGLLWIVYLAAAGLLVPYGLAHAVPRAWVSLSWAGAAVAYWLVSLLLRNRPYRWLALPTLLAAVGHAFVVDLARLEPGARIVSFIALGVVLLLVAWVYARSRLRARRGHSANAPV